MDIARSIFLPTAKYNNFVTQVLRFAVMQRLLNYAGFITTLTIVRLAPITDEKMTVITILAVYSKVDNLGNLKVDKVPWM